MSTVKINISIYKWLSLSTYVLFKTDMHQVDIMNFDLSSQNACY